MENCKNRKDIQPSVSLTFNCKKKKLYKQKKTVIPLCLLAGVSGPDFLQKSSLFESPMMLRFQSHPTEMQRLLTCNLQERFQVKKHFFLQDTPHKCSVKIPVLAMNIK